MEEYHLYEMVQIMSGIKKVIGNGVYFTDSCSVLIGDYDYNTKQLYDVHYASSESVLINDDNDNVKNGNGG